MLALTAMAADQAVVVRQFIGMGGLAMAGQIGGGGDQQGPVGEQVAAMEAAVHWASDAHRNVHVFGVEIHQPVVELDLEPHPGVAGQEGRQARCQPGGAEALEHRDPKRALWRHRQGLQGLHQLIGLLQQAHRAGKEVLPLLGQHQLAGAALEQRDPQLLLQRIYGAGHRGGGQVEGAGGPGETPRLHHLSQDTDAIQHGSTFAVNAKLLQLVAVFYPWMKA